MWAKFCEVYAPCSERAAVDELYESIASRQDDFQNENRFIFTDKVGTSVEI